MTKKRVVVTGIGVVSPYGVGTDKFWNSLVEGKSGISTTSSIDLEKTPVKISGKSKISILMILLTLKKPKEWIDLLILRLLQQKKQSKMQNWKISTPILIE